MPIAATSRTAKVLFGLACCAVFAGNTAIVIRERDAGGALEKIRQHTSGASGQSVADEPEHDVGLAFSKLETEVGDTADRLARLRNTAPVGLLARADVRLRQFRERVSSATEKFAALAMIPNERPSEATVRPRILYADYGLIEEFLEMAAPPNTARNPATYTFTISYAGQIFPEKKIGEIKRGQSVGVYNLDAVNVETRQGPVVKDKIVRYRRRKGGVREPVWSYARLPSKQVVVVEFSAVADRSRHTIHYPASDRGDQSRVRREVPVGWVEMWETEEECSSRFPVMAGSEFSWSGAGYRVEEVTPQELKLTALASGKPIRWLLGGGP